MIKICPPAQWLRANAWRGGCWSNVAALAATISTMLLLVQNWSIACVIQRIVIDRAAYDSVEVPLILLQLAFLGRGLMVRLQTSASTRCGIQVCQSVRADVLDILAQRGPLWVRRKHSATFSNRVLDQVDALHGYYSNFRQQILLCLTIPMVIILAVFTLNRVAVLIMLFTTPLLLLNMAMIGVGAKQMQDTQFMEMSRMSRHFISTLRGLPTIKLFGLGKAQAYSVYSVSDELRRCTMNVLKLAFLSSSALEFFASVSIALLAIYISFTYLGHLNFGTRGHGINLFIGLFLLIISNSLYQPFRDLGTHYHAKAEAESSAEYLIEWLCSHCCCSCSTNLRVGVTVKGVSARYPHQRRAALNALSITIAPGETLAVVGHSGAGKSTLFNLLLGFLVPYSGRILIHKDAISWVNQRPKLIAGTLAENLRLDNDDNDDKIWAALAQTNLELWARTLPYGLKTSIGEGGQPVSGGQARRITFSRVLLRHTPLVLLDEPTASIDSDSEAVILRAIDRLRHGRTIVMLTHHIELLRIADRIILLSRGTLMR